MSPVRNDILLVRVKATVGDNKQSILPLHLCVNVLNIATSQLSNYCTADTASQKY